MFPQIFGKYVLERELASGGMARVFLATLRGAGGFEKRLVVKQIRPELASDQSFIRRFVAEAKTTVDLSHANIVPVYELGAEQGTYYIAMEYCAGVSLAELLRGGAVSPSEGAYIGVEICRALDYAHRKAGVVHRDVTPRNVMIDPEGMVRLIDFGIAAPPSGDPGGGPCFGSPGHMPPEQLGGGALTPAADVFAVAALLIEVWTGLPPFRRDSLEASERARREPRAALSDAEPRLRSVEPLIRAALSDAPAERPQTAEELARPLREFLRQDDLGDIARRLGQRVSECLTRLGRTSRADLLPRTGERPSLAPERPSSGGATLTFAARDALLSWTAKIESQPPRAASSELSAAGDDGGPATSPLDFISEIESGITAPNSLPVRLDGMRRRRRHNALLLGATLAGTLLLALAGAWRSRATHDAAAHANAAASALEVAPVPPAGLPAVPDAIVAPSPAPATRASRPDTPRAHAAARPQDTPRPPPSSAARAATPATPGNPSPAPAARAASAPLAPAVRAAAANAQGARLSLTAEPAAWVEVDAVRVGRTPLADLAVSPGRHAIVFVSQLLGERLETSVSAPGRATTRIHADFSSATPQVYVR